MAPPHGAAARAISPRRRVCAQPERHHPKRPLPAGAKAINLSALNAIIQLARAHLAGGKSVFGRAMEEIFGAGGAKSAREGMLKVFSEVSAVLTNEVMPVIQAIASSPFFSGALKLVGETLLGILNLIGLAFASNSDKVDEMGSRFLRNTNAIGDAIDGLISKMKEFLGLGDEEPKFDVARPLSPRSQALADKTTFFRDKPEPESFAESFGFKGVKNAPSADPTRVRPTAPGSRAPVTLTDQRKIEINLGDKSSGGTARTVAGAVDDVLTKDRRQTLSAVSG